MLRRIAMLAFLAAFVAVLGNAHQTKLLTKELLVVKVSNNVPQQPPGVHAAWCDWDITITSGTCIKSGDWHDVDLRWTSVEPRNDAEIVYADSYGGDWFERDWWPTPEVCASPPSNWFARSQFEWGGPVHDSFVQQRVGETVHNFSYAQFTH
jgi:hypothetical protein